MDTATQNLENDHVHILRLIDVMEQMVKNPSPEVKHLEMVVDLIKNYADGFHHAKEENLLFPLMVKKGYSTEQGPVAVMLSDHEQGRKFVRGMAEAISGYKNGKTGALSLVFENMKGYISLLRSHIHKENNILFRMADSVFNEQDHKILLEQFKKIENSNICGGVLLDCVNQIDSLAAEYKV